MTPRQRATVRRATRRRDLDPSEQEGELNIVPLLDIVINLMLFLLATAAATMALAETDATLPGTCRGWDCHRVPSMELSVTLPDEAVVLASREGRIARLPNPRPGVYDFDGLGAQLARTHEALPDEHAVVLTADPMVPYEALIGAMDAIHGSFEDVRLSAGVR